MEMKPMDPWWSNSPRLFNWFYNRRWYFLKLLKNIKCAILFDLVSYGTVCDFIMVVPIYVGWTMFITQQNNGNT
jgi:hypothetical protein